jgi:hypothetical protein
MGEEGVGVRAGQPSVEGGAKAGQEDKQVTGEGTCGIGSLRVLEGGRLKREAARIDTYFKEAVRW